VWVENRSDVRGNPTYKQDETGFLHANFRYMMVKDKEPFIFPTQAQQVFYLDEEQNSYWKVVIHKKPRSSRITMDSSFNSSGIDDDVPWLNTTMTHPLMPQDANLVGAKGLSTKELARINETFSHLVMRNLKCMISIRRYS
jgi:hypothetical protein